MLTVLLFPSKFLVLLNGVEGRHISAVVPPMKQMAYCVSWLRHGIRTGAMVEFSDRSQGSLNDLLLASLVQWCNRKINVL